MKFKIGDKVKFLNKIGGGYITQILDNSIVRVIVEGGLEYPIAEKELILIDPQTSLEKYFSEDFNIAMPTKGELQDRHKKFTNSLNFKGKSLPEDYEIKHEIEKREHEKENKKNTGEIKLIDNPDGDKLEEGVYLSFVPIDQTKLKESDLYISIINYTKYDIIVNSYVKKSTREYKGLDFNKIAPFSRLNLCTVVRTDLIKWLQTVFQVIFHTDTTKIVPNPVHIEINLKLTYFDINENYRTSNVMNERAFMVMLNDIYYNEKINIPKEEKSKDVLISEEKAQQAMAPIPPQLIDRHRIGKHKAEVDLHISALREDYSNLKSVDILHEQLDYFRSTLESAIDNHYQEVVFIHGIGNGVLKESITKILRSEFPDIWFHDAPFSKYGNGAIELFLSEDY